MGVTFNELIERIGKPYYRDNQADVVIYCGDCRDILPKIPDKSIDLVLTDPPYGKGLSYGDKVKDTNALFIEITSWLAGLQFPTVFTIPSTKLFDMPRPDWIGVWYKPMAFGFWNTLLYPHWEAICFYRLEGKLKHDDVWVSNTEKPNGHPAPKPVKFWQSLLAILPGDLILDPFLGSGTTAYCAKKLGRKCIGIEIEEKYCEIAKNRLSQGVLL